MALWCPQSVPGTSRCPAHLRRNLRRAPLANKWILGVIIVLTCAFGHAAGQTISCGQTVSGSTSGRPNQYGNSAGDAFYDFTVCKEEVKWVTA